MSHSFSYIEVGLKLHRDGFKLVKGLPTPVGGRASHRPPPAGSHFFLVKFGCRNGWAQGSRRSPVRTQSITYFFMVRETFELHQLKFAPSQLLPDFLGSDRNEEFSAFKLVANLVWIGFVAGLN